MRGPGAVEMKVSEMQIDADSSQRAQLEVIPNVIGNQEDLDLERRVDNGGEAILTDVFSASMTRK